MLTKRAVAAYTAACTLSLVALLAQWYATQVPWLQNPMGHTIGLWKIVRSGKNPREFPSRFICRTYEGFCAAWRTATFLFTLALVPEALVLLALVFSWAFHHRKKTVMVSKYLLIAAIALEATAMVLWRWAYSDLHNVLGSGNWQLIGGWHYVLLSGAANSLLLMLIIPFRHIVRSAHDLDRDAMSIYNDSSDDEPEETTGDEDDISIPDNIPPEQIDFYVFNTRARRRELARGTV